MNSEVQAWLKSFTPSVLAYLESLRHKNPLIGSNAGANQNSVFVEIGKNITIDRILDDRKESINPTPKSNRISGGSELLGQATN